MAVDSTSSLSLNRRRCTGGSGQLKRGLLVSAVVVGLGLGLNACGGGGDEDDDAETSVVRVPADAPTISAAVDEADEGDLVLVAPGVYRESVEIDTPGIVLRGESRNGVVIDGEGVRGNGIHVQADGVSVENLTVRDHTVNGVLFSGAGSTDDAGLADHSEVDPADDPPLQRFAMRYVTAYNNGLYGLYAFDAQHGVIEHSYASGHPDSGIYVGQCKPCDVVVAENTAELNAIGYEGTNASDDVFVVENRLTRNRVGLTTNSEHVERLAPQENGTVAANFVSANDEPGAPETGEGGFGAGIVISGGTENLVSRNRVTEHPLAGIVIASGEGMDPVGNQVRDNVSEGNRLDLAYVPGADTPGRGNCFAGNRFATTLPAALEGRFGCPAPDEPFAGPELPSIRAPDGPIFLEVERPPRQPEMPGDPMATPKPLPSSPSLPRPESLEMPAAEYVPAGTTPFPSATRSSGR